MFEFIGMFEYEEIQKELFQLYTAKKILEKYGINTRVIDKRILDFYDMLYNDLESEGYDER